MGTNKKTFGTGTKRTAFRTDLAGVVGTDFDYINPSLHCLVADEVLQLVEAPAIQPEVESSASPASSYAFNIFQYNSSSAAVVNDLFAYNMVPVSLETPFPARYLFEQFLCRPCAFALEPCPQTPEFEHVSFDFSSTEELPAACYSNMVYSNINTNLKSVRNLDVNISGKSNVQEHSLMSVNGEQSSLRRPIEILPIVFRNFYWNVNPAFDSSEPNFIKSESESSLVKSERHKLLENRLRAFVCFDRFKGLGSNTISVYHKLGRQAKPLPCFIIAKMMKFVSVADARSKSFISNIRNGFRILSHSIKKQFIYRDFEFYSGYGFHNKNIRDMLTYKGYGQRCPVGCGYAQKGENQMKPFWHPENSPKANFHDIKGGWQFPSTLKSGVSLPYVL